jgi:hypothetical protein
VTNVFSRQIGQGLSTLAFNIRATFNPNSIVQRERETQTEVNNLLASTFAEPEFFEERSKLTIYTRLSEE